MSHVSANLQIYPIMSDVILCRVYLIVSEWFPGDELQELIFKQSRANIGVYYRSL